MPSDVFLITGASRGIGAATAELAARRGYRVAISYRRDEQAADRVIRELRALGADAMAVQADVSVESDVVSLFAIVERELGRPRVLVNNAGIVDRMARVEQFDMARLSRMFAVNVIGSILCAREAIRRMSTRLGGPGGTIINVSSVAARLGAPNEYVDYAASKAAIDAFTVGLAKEVSDEGIRVNAVRPGIIDTEIHAQSGDPHRVARVQESLPMKRAGLASEVAAAIVWLASPEASYCSGAILDISGAR